MSQNFGVTEYPNTFKRQAAFPLDQSSKFNTLDEAIEYAKFSLIAYEGQIISVVENDNIALYMLKQSNGADNERYELKSIDIDKVGTWSVCDNANKTKAILDFDIFSPISTNYYEVYFDNYKFGEKMLLTESLATSLKNFKDSINNIVIKFYNDDTVIFEVKAKATNVGETTIFGNLYLINFLD